MRTTLPRLSKDDPARQSQMKTKKHVDGINEKTYSKSGDGLTLRTQ